MRTIMIGAIFCGLLSGETKDWTDLTREGLRLRDQGRYADAEKTLRAAVETARAYPEGG